MAQWVTYSNSKGEQAIINMDEVVNMTDTGKGTRLFTSLVQPSKDGKPVRVAIMATEPIEHFSSQVKSDMTLPKR
jgi:hypothetical protein